MHEYFNNKRMLIKDQNKVSQKISNQESKRLNKAYEPLTFVLIWLNLKQSLLLIKEINEVFLNQGQIFRIMNE